MEENKDKITQFTTSVNNMATYNTTTYGTLDYLNWGTGEYPYEYSPLEINDILNGIDPTAKRELSRYFFKTEGFYKKLIYYYSTLLNYTSLTLPNSISGKQLSKDVLKRYNQVLKLIYDFRPEEKWQRIALRVLTDGAYYGIVGESTKKSIAIIDLPCDYCRSKYKDVFGNDIVEFDVNYFNSIADLEVREIVLKTFPEIVRKYYRRYMNGKVSTSWLRLPIDMGVMFSFSDDCTPYFVETIPAAIQYDQAVGTEQERALEEIRKIIVQKIPHLNDGTLVFEPDEAEVMHKGAVNMMKGNKNLSIFTTYADVDSIVSKTAAEANNNVIERMGQNVYSKAGVSSHIFAAIGSQTILISIKKDISVMMILARKFQAFLTRVINSIFEETNVYYSYTILPVSLYTQSDYITDAFKLAQSGYSYLIPGVALGIDQKQLISAKDLENNLLDVSNVFIPLQSAYTQSANSSGEGPGRPSLKQEEKSEKTIQNEDSLDRQGGSK